MVPSTSNGRACASRGREKFDFQLRSLHVRWYWICVSSPSDFHQCGDSYSPVSCDNYHLRLGTEPYAPAVHGGGDDDGGETSVVLTSDVKVSNDFDSLNLSRSEGHLSLEKSSRRYPCHFSKSFASTCTASTPSSRESCIGS